MVRAVLVDANVLYSRALRDYLLDAADEEIIAIAWSREILDEVPDDDDRHVLAAAIAAEATILCTANTKDFPEDVAAPLGFEVMTPDALLSLLIAEYPAQMLTVHTTSVARLRGATDASTIAALQRAGAPVAAARMVPLLEAAGLALD
ncbi:hypothetical protein [Jiangella alkaliphila]|uniref:PIN domain-containing protein n=1 Tax=Jiangella alkaliphila TaxID=419479 RepID=A0A1H2L2J6_9ACTN|nr:hypothetical protein [Jiangella alkaliphila]SDU74811.1 hypothetical protein SAMN04488563_4820 [Jiangella alkaliphila]